jgi:two-component sensor histidine kinase
MSQKNISHTLSVDQINFDIDTAIPIGLIINELISNAYKHAFTDRDGGHISIAIESMQEPHYYKLTVRDNGKGISEEIKNKKSKSLGLKLVNTLGVRQLKGNLQIINDGGTLITLIFKDLEKEVTV